MLCEPDCKRNVGSGAATVVLLEEEDDEDAATPTSASESMEGGDHGCSRCAGTNADEEDELSNDDDAASLSDGDAIE
jgi:hypothetical protein